MLSVIILKVVSVTPSIPALCHFAGCPDLNIVMLHVIMLNVVILSAIKLNVVMLIVVAPLRLDQC